MLSTLVLSNENRQLASRREEAPHLFRGGEDVTGGINCGNRVIIRNELGVLQITVFKIIGEMKC